jgi:copper resistance protein B
VNRLAAIVFAPALAAAPAAAQTMNHHHMPGMQAPAQPPEPAAPQEAMPDMPGMAMPTPDAAAPAPSQPSPWPGDYAADRAYDPAAMAHARAMMRREMGGVKASKVMVNLAEYRTGAQGDGYRWEGQGWFGGDIDRLVVRSEGEGAVKGGLESAEAQALYSHAVGRYLDLRAGVRQDFAPRARTYAALGAQSLLPYWFEVEGAVFLSTEGEVLARAEASYDLRLFQRVVLQPRVELNFAAQDTPETRTGAGLSTAEVGLRLRYEIRREFAPYVGVSWDRRVGRTADYWRAAGEDARATTFVAGLSAFF